MPKAAIHKHRNFKSSKYEIWVPNYILIASPARNAVLAENTNHRDFGLSISVRPNTRHYG